MNQVVIANENGEQRIVEEGAVRLLPGEKVIGSLIHNKENAVMIEVVKQTGLPLGDVIARATKAFGIQPCVSCTKRIKILNRISEIGIAEAVRQIKETF